MEFYHTFWARPLIGNFFYQQSKEIKVNTYLTCFALSFTKIHKLGFKINLVTDYVGSLILDFIPYDNVIIVNEDNSDIQYAASFKFKALKVMNLGDCLIDEDTFLDLDNCYPCLENVSKASDAVCHFYEKDNLSWSKPAIDILRKYPLMFPLEQISWPNTSLLIINNQKLKNQYIQQYNYHKNLKIDWKGFYFWPDIIFEQKFLEELCIQNNYKLNYAVEWEIGNSAMAHKGFVHLGDNKFNLLPIITKRLKQENYNLFVKTLNKINWVLSSINVYTNIYNITSV